MKNFKNLVKTLLFSAFMVVVVSSGENTITLNENLTGVSIPTCCDECPNLEPIISGH